MAEGTTTLGSFTARVLSNLGIVTPEGNLKVKIKNELNNQVAQLVDKVKKDPKYDSFYTPETPITFTSFLFNMRSLSDFESFRGLREITYGTISKVDWQELENLKINSFYDDEYKCAESDKMLKLFVGREINTTSATFYLKYSRLHTPAVATTDKIDIPDSFIEDLIQSVTAVFQSQTDDAPEKLS